MRNQEIGIISYAGLDKAALWRQAKQFYHQDDGNHRFSAFMPLFPVELVQNMRFIGKGGSLSAFVSRNGFSIDQSEYHRQLYEEMPELYTGENYLRNFDYDNHFVGRGVVTVDQAWADRFPQYEPFMGERLVIYMIGGGGQAVAVPESIYPRGCGVLHSAEMDMRITARGDHYAAYVQQRVNAGEDYDAEIFGREYLRQFMLSPVTIAQKELGRTMQDMSLVRSLQEDAPVEPGRFSEFSRRGENLPQYAPYHVACDTFERMPVTRNTARLMQLYYSGDEHISDLWFSYQEACEYIDRQKMTLDVRALCQGFQIPPRYAPDTQGGRYPDQVRVVSVLDRTLQLMAANTINNPAYGSGMNPLGMINRLIYLEDSAEMIRTERLNVENSNLVCENLSLPEREYVTMIEKASMQESKGMLIDTLYRREAVLTQLREGTDAYRRAKEMLDKQMENHQTLLTLGSSRSDRAQLSGYDADIDYLHRLEMSRMPVENDENIQPIAFAPDALRMLSIESGFTMRSQLKRYTYGELAIPASELEPDDDYLFSVDSEADKPAATEETENTGNDLSEKVETQEASVSESLPEEIPVEEETDEEPGTSEAVEINEAFPSGAENPENAEIVTDEMEEDAFAEDVAEAPQESAVEKLEKLVKEAKPHKTEKSLWSRTLPKAEQLSLFEPVAEAEKTASLSMQDSLKNHGGSLGEEMVSRMSQLLEKNQKE